MNYKKKEKHLAVLFLELRNGNILIGEEYNSRICNINEEVIKNNYQMSKYSIRRLVKR